jgi:hypothetical protein
MAGYFIPQYLYNCGDWTVADAEIDEFRRMTVEKTTLMEIRVFRNDYEIIRCRHIPKLLHPHYR